MSMILMRTDLLSDPRVLRVVAVTKAKRLQVVGAFYWLWSAAQTQSADGYMAMLTPEMIDTEVGITGFSDAVKAVGWLEVTEDGVRIPDFDSYFGASAKTRAKERLKKARQRWRKAPAGDNEGTEGGQEGDKEGTRSGHVGATDRIGTERKENGTERNEPDGWIPPGVLNTPDFRTEWQRWRLHLDENGKALTPSTTHALLTDLLGMGSERAVAAIRHSIRNGWVSIHEPKGSDGAPVKPAPPRPVDPHAADRALAAKWYLTLNNDQRREASGVVNIDQWADIARKGVVSDPILASWRASKSTGSGEKVGETA